MNKKTKLVWKTLLVLLIFSTSMFMGIILHKYGYISQLKERINSWSNLLYHRACNFHELHLKLIYDFEINLLLLNIQNNKMYSI